MKLKEKNEFKKRLLKTHQAWENAKTNTINSSNPRDSEQHKETQRNCRPGDARGGRDGVGMGAGGGGLRKLHSVSAVVPAGIQHRGQLLRSHCAGKEVVLHL